jgi:hypothetical protein
VIARLRIDQRSFDVSRPSHSAFRTLGVRNSKNYLAESTLSVLILLAMTTALYRNTWSAMYFASDASGLSAQHKTPRRCLHST